MATDAFPDDDGALVALAGEVGEAALARRVRLITAESCTGGGIAAAITAIAGSSQWFDRGFVTYSDEAKVELLGVRRETLAACGAVSEEVAREMAIGALRHGRGEVAIAVTGVAGPSGGSDAKPVGTVCFGWSVVGGRFGGGDRVDTSGSDRLLFAGDRAEVRRQSIVWALTRLCTILRGIG